MLFRAASTTLYRKGRAWLVCAFWALACLTVPGWADPVTIAIEPTTSSVPVGGTGEIHVRIDGLNDGTAPSLGTYDLTLTFNPAILQFDSIVFGPYLGPFFGALQSFQVDPNGTLVASEVSLDDPFDLDDLQPDTFTLFSATFAVISAGASAVDITSILLGDALGVPIIAASVSHAGIVGAVAVPEPASLWLVAAGLVGLGSVFRRTR